MILVDGKPRFTYEELTKEKLTKEIELMCKYENSLKENDYVMALEYGRELFKSKYSSFIQTCTIKIDTLIELRLHNDIYVHSLMDNKNK